ncbi:hypothetical protein F2Q68_00010020 [Brassica cretica]|uniref:Uncharacterized protein n=1 Tax=Brassica cretica TaxID=69181 RepID=A0A8S9KWY3_BRACR|nr:hypothetical protein F2Q68_00010020 [Brassica cretica]
MLVPPLCLLGLSLVSPGVVMFVSILFDRSGVALDERQTRWRERREKECELESFAQNSRPEQPECLLQRHR